MKDIIKIKAFDKIKTTEFLRPLFGLECVCLSLSTLLREKEQSIIVVVLECDFLVIFLQFTL